MSKGDIDLGDVLGEDEGGADARRLLDAAGEGAAPGGGGGGGRELDDDIEDDEFESEGRLLVFDVEAHARTVVAILQPVSLTMLLVVLLVRTIHRAEVNVSIGLVYTEEKNDSTGTKLGGSILNALIFVAIVTLTTVVFVLLFKFRCMRILYGWLIASTTIMLAMFGALLLYLCCQALNVAFDYGTFVALVWNFAAVGIIAVFWRAPPLVNRGYLIAVSALMAVFFTFLPEWTTWSILAAISIYDLVAVLCPFGPLRMLVEAAQQRQERIPALLYNGFALLTMADGDGGGDEEEEEGGVKLGLGDFVFYSVLLGRAALFDIITVFTCFIAILTGLFGTLVLLAIFQKALPALPFSIALAMMFFFLTRYFLMPYVLVFGVNNIFI